MGVSCRAGEFGMSGVNSLAGLFWKLSRRGASTCLIWYVQAPLPPMVLRLETIVLLRTDALNGSGSRKPIEMCWVDLLGPHGQLKAFM